MEADGLLGESLSAYLRFTWIPAILPFPSPANSHAWKSITTVCSQQLRVGL